MRREGHEKRYMHDSGGEFGARCEDPCSCDFSKRTEWANHYYQKKGMRTSLLILFRFERVVRAIVTIQAGARARQARVYVKRYRRYRAAVKIQSKYRSLLEKRILLTMLKGINQMQVRWRMRQAKGQLKKLKAEAKEVPYSLHKARVNVIPFFSPCIV